MKQFATQQERIEGEMKQFATQQERIEGEMKQFATQQERIEGEMKQFATQQERIEGEMKQFATQQERIEVARALRAWRQSGNRARIVRSCHIGDTGVADDIEFSDIAGVRCIFGQARVADPSILGAVRFLSYTPLVFGLDGDGRPHVAVAPEQGGVGGMGVLHAVREVDARGTNRMTVAALAFPSVR